MKDDLGDRMKLYEGIEAGRRFLPMIPVIARIDGRAFSTFTRGLERPFDVRMTECMIHTAQYLAEETNACMAYTQSDEITLAWHSTDMRSQIWFDGRIQKMTSQLAALATLRFYRAASQLLPPQYVERMPSFDARVWTVPNRTEGANVFVWREWDATKNSIAMTAHEHFSPKELHGKHGKEMLAMLEAKGIMWAEHPVSFKRGTYIQRVTKTIAFSREEIERLPEKHAARSNPNLMVERSVFEVVDLPIITTISNREAVIFDGAAPLLISLPVLRPINEIELPVALA